MKKSIAYLLILAALWLTAAGQAFTNLDFELCGSLLVNVARDFPASDSVIVHVVACLADELKHPCNVTTKFK